MGKAGEVLAVSGISPRDKKRNAGLPKINAVNQPVGIRTFPAGPIDTGAKSGPAS
jgi:hypothetical protein